MPKLHHMRSLLFVFLLAGLACSCGNRKELEKKKAELNHYYNRNEAAISLALTKLGDTLLRSQYQKNIDRLTRENDSLRVKMDSIDRLLK